MDENLAARAAGGCELCGAQGALSAYTVAPKPSPEGDVAVCASCAAQLAPDAALDAKHWFCLQESIWSEIAPVQVQSWRLLHRLEESWAAELLEQAYLDEDTLAWAQAGADEEAEAVVPVVDCNGAPLAHGDSVTLVRSLDVKGAGFTAKRGTLVRNIRLTDDPTHVEGRVNKVSIYLKTCFLKKS
jgi:protein PhnA